jgi:hypothetical protein
VSFDSSGAQPSLSTTEPATAAGTGFLRTAAFLWPIPDIFAIKGFLKKLALCLKNANPTSETRIVEQRLYSP